MAETIENYQKVTKTVNLIKNMQKCQKTAKTVKNGKKALKYKKHLKKGQNRGCTFLNKYLKSIRCTSQNDPQFTNQET